MDFSLTPEQQDIRAVTMAFCERVYPASELVRIAAGTDRVPDRATWRRMGDELGLAGVAVEERLGGFGGSLLDVTVVSEGLGRSLAPVPFLSTAVLGAGLLAPARGERPETLLSAIAGDALVLALAERDDPAAPVVVRTDAEGGPRLDGVKRLVLDGAAAEHLLVVAGKGREREVLIVDAGAAGVETTAVAALDPTRQLAEVRLRDAGAERLRFDDPPAAVLERARTRAAVVLAGEQLGAAERCLEIAVEYAKDRVQFGRPIGSFQAVKHLCADVAVGVEMARWTVYYAAALADEEPDSVWTVGRSAAVFAGETLTRAAATLVQVLGGIGFTAEHEAQLYLRRARATRHLLAGVEEHLDALADVLGAERAPLPVEGAA